MQFKIGYQPASGRWFAYAVVSLCMLLFTGLGFVAAVVYWSITYHIKQRADTSDHNNRAVLLSTIWLLLLCLWWIVFPGQFSLWRWYVLSIPLAPIGAILIDVMTPLIRRAFTYDLDELLVLQTQDQARHLDRNRRRAARYALTAVPDHIPMAPVIETHQTFPGHTGVAQHRGWLHLSLKALGQHMFVQGSPGSGKTEMLKWLTTCVLQHTDWDLFFIDGKGDEGLAEYLVEAAGQLRGFSPPVFKLGQGVRGSAYNAFIGQRQDIYNRLVASLDTGQVTGGAAYYANANKTLLQLICYAPCGPPHDFADLQRRLNLKWLVRAYKDDKQELHNIAAVKKHLDDLAVWLQPLIRDFQADVHRDGFTFDQARVGIFSIRTQSVGETSRSLLNILNADLLDFMGKRQHRPTVVIVDEFQAFKNESLVETLSLGRSSQLALVLATQDVASLGKQDLARRILANTKTKILMATDFPEDVGQIAGTRQILEHSYQHDEGLVTGVGTSRLQHQHMISLNDVARLAPGEAFLIRQRCSARVQFRLVD